MSGTVYLVGAGPGDPDLLTVKAARLLREADIVLHDALVSDAILALIRPRAQVIDIGKRRGHKLLTQEEINSLLVTYAASYRTVVRLKGGDPSVFGRAGEEIEALVEAGIAYEIVPGITSALAAAASAKISLTDRRHASSVILSTAHRKPGSSRLQWENLAARNSTLVIYMPGQDYGILVEQLREAGWDPATACAVVSNAGRPEQQVLWTDIHRLAITAALPAPSIVIVGECARALPRIDELELPATSDAVPVRPAGPSDITTT